MLFEHRTYTLRPGTLERFWQAQDERGYAPVRSILERLVGYFSASTGASDQVVHLYRYDSYEDWTERLHGLYRVTELEPYFKTVRALMSAQENKFLVPAPFAELSPLWSGAQDWRPSRGAVFRKGTVGGEALVEEMTTTLLPGAMPSYWQVYREHGLRLLEDQSDQLMGCFTSVVGRLHQVVHYRVYAEPAEWQQAQDGRRRNPHWLAFQRAVGPLIVSDESKLLQPSANPELSPLFA